MKYFDKNGKEIRTGMIVKISGAFFKNDNGLYFVHRQPGDPTWSGRQLSLTGINKNGTLSKSRTVSFWPMMACTSNRMKNAECREWNEVHATIEIVEGINTEYMLDEFRSEAEQEADELTHCIWNFGEDSPAVDRIRKRCDWYNLLLARIG